MLQVPGATRGDHGDVDGRGDSLQERQIVAIAGAVAVHAGEQDLSGAAASRFCRPGDDVETAGLPAAVSVNAPSAAIRLATSVDGDHDALTAKDVCSRVDEIRIVDGRGIDRDLVRARREQCPNVV